MPSVTCPSCDTRQPLDEGADSYTCTNCATTWGFVTCGSCGSRFHARPGVRKWSCPNCGRRQGAARPAASPTARQAASPTARPAARQAASPTARPAARPALRGPGAFSRIPRGPIVAGVAVLVVILGALILTRNDDAATVSPTPPPLGVEEARTRMCRHLLDLQVVRVDSLTRTQETLRTDAQVLRTAGDATTADDVDTLVAAVDELIQSIQDRQNALKANRAVQKALRPLPCG